FMFVYGPALLMIGPAHVVAAAALTGLAGVTALSAALVGYGRRPLPVWERALLAAAAIALIFPGLMGDVVGFTILAWSFARRGPSAAGRDPIATATAARPDAELAPATTGR